jgi:hypothetical protein
VKGQETRLSLFSGVAMHFKRLLTLSASAVLIAGCSSGVAAQTPVDESLQQPTLPQNLCDLLPQADAERIMTKSLVQQRNDDSGCHYQDARGTTGTGLWVFLNAFKVSDQCRLTPGSEPLSGVGDEACIAVRQPAGLYTTVVFGGGGRTFEVIAPGEDKASELATAVAKVILSKLGS